jgi:hypothetical protein
MGRPAFLQFLCKHYTILAAIVFLVVVMCIIYVCLGISWQRYETCSGGGEFNLFFYQISFLGDPVTNPCGYIYFIVALWTLGYASILLLYFLTRALRALKARVAGVFAFFFGLSIPGMFVVGVVPWSLDGDLHLISAAVAFGGSGLAYLLTGIGIIIARIRDRTGKIPAALVIPFLVYVPFIIFGISLQVSGYIEGTFEIVGESWRSFTLWEWLLFFSLLSICITTTFPLVRVRGSQATPASTC